MSYKLTKEELEGYVALGLSASDIAEKIGCVKSTVYSQLRKYSIVLPTRDLSSGERYGLLSIISKAGTDGHNALYVCKCQCGSLVTVARPNLVTGGTKSCGCSHRRSGNKHPLFKGCGDVSSKYWSSLTLRARKRGLRCSVSIEDAWLLFQEQKGKCALTGLDITLVGEQTASLDRIDSGVGYEIGNIQWVHKDVNRMKQEFPEDYFVNLCRLVANKRQ